MKKQILSFLGYCLVILISFIAVSYIVQLNEAEDKPEIEQPVIEPPAKHSSFDTEVDCLVEALWHEARGEDLLGIEAVAAVIRNRVEHSKYPSSYCKVIKQDSQFSYTLKPYNKAQVIYKHKNQELVQQIKQTAILVVRGELKGFIGKDVLWYARQDVDNYWTRKHKAVLRVGKHIFYTK